jgi:SAM-dependent methyltransferase
MLRRKRIIGGVTQSLAAAASADYGVEAPRTIRNVAVGAGACLGVWVVAALVPGPGFWISAVPLLLGIGCALAAGAMLWRSKIGKLFARARLLDRLRLAGHERVLDVGCGRGLVLVGAAHRLRRGRGRAVGIDLWQGAAASGARIESTLANIRHEAVADRAEVRTADMRRMPFPDASFDAVVSRDAIHALEDAADRARVIAEIVRVLKPGGRTVIADVAHLPEYAAQFERLGCENAARRPGKGALLLYAKPSIR